MPLTLLDLTLLHRPSPIPLSSFSSLSFPRLLLAPPSPYLPKVCERREDGLWQARDRIAGESKLPEAGQATEGVSTHATRQSPCTDVRNGNVMS